MTVGLLGMTFHGLCIQVNRMVRNGQIHVVKTMDVTKEMLGEVVFFKMGFESFIISVCYCRV